MSGFSWTCPFCHQPTTVTDPNYSRDTHIIADMNSTDGRRSLRTTFISCPNPDCRRLTLTASLYVYGVVNNRWTETSILKDWQLVPESKALAFPDYIPRAILDDYGEALLIADLSPKAAAALARRCLQGIVRDFWGVTTGTLKAEIEAIKDEVDNNTWKAIDAVRSVGNIGAHMEKDVNLIIDVESDEAKLLIGLSEVLLKDWYMARHQKEEHFEALAKLAQDKKAARNTENTNAD